MYKETFLPRSSTIRGVCTLQRTTNDCPRVLDTDAFKTSSLHLASLLGAEEARWSCALYLPDTSTFHLCSLGVTTKNAVTLC